MLFATVGIKFCSYLCSCLATFYEPRSSYVIIASLIPYPAYLISPTPSPPTIPFLLKFKLPSLSMASSAPSARAITSDWKDLICLTSTCTVRARYCRVLSPVDYAGMSKPADLITIPNSLHVAICLLLVSEGTALAIDACVVPIARSSALRRLCIGPLCPPARCTPQSHRVWDELRHSLHL